MTTGSLCVKDLNLELYNQNIALPSWAFSQPLYNKRTQPVNCELRSCVVLKQVRKHNLKDMKIICKTWRTFKNFPPVFYLGALRFELRNFLTQTRHLTSRHYPGITENIRFERMWLYKPNKFQAYHLKPLSQFSPIILVILPRLELE